MLVSEAPTVMLKSKLRESAMESINISAILYQEGEHWIAQCLEFDITAQAPSLPDLQKVFAMKVAAEMSISLDLGKEPLTDLPPAPDFFWRMFAEATVTVSAESQPVRISDGARTPRINPRMKVGLAQVA